MASLLITGGATATSTTKFHGGNNMRDDDADSFLWSIKFMQLHLETMNVDSFRNSQQEMPNSDEQPDQEQHAVDYNHTTVEAR